ncbi:MAG TPA: hypothetical protein VFO10_19375 [Oligoflexus sp.]|uniref:hypothetical protein n=1 Tax=Oligoflexus sp. TaxID=1971216 RepID=UPI002D7FBF99|nr:hypothetical protein [Oligoflexus sp.]HET9239432.1 hypothetical protein [Oligoflexus sp.]
MNLRMLPHKAGALLAFAFLVLGACVPGGKDQRKSAPQDSSVATPGADDPEIQELGATDPVSIAGVNLIADYQNTRARCDFKNIAADDYEIFCRVTITSELGSEFLPLKVKPTLQLSWQQPVQTRGEFRLDRCQESPDHLSFQCQGQLKSGTSALEFPLQIIDSALQQSRMERPEVLLPYFVGVIEGDFSDTHRSFQGLPDPSVDTAVLDKQLVQAGFFRTEVDRFDHKVNVLDACEHGDLIIMATPTYIYIHDSRKNELKAVAGRFDENVRFSYRFEDPLRLNHQTYRVACGPEGFTTYHANSGFDVDSTGLFSSALRALHFDYQGRLLRFQDALTDQVTGRVAQNKSNRNLSALGAGRQRIGSIVNYDGENFQLVDIIKSADQLIWTLSTYAPNKTEALRSRVLQTLDITAGDVITGGLVDASVLARFVRDRPEILLYSGRCNYNLYDVKEGRIQTTVGPKKDVMTAPGACAEDTVIPGREFARFGPGSFIFKIDNETWRTVDSQQQIKPLVSGTLAFTQEPVDLLKQGLMPAFDGRVPVGSKVYPLAGERLLVTNLTYLGLIQQGRLQLISANNRLRTPEVGRIHNIFFEASTQKILRIYNRTQGTAATAVIEVLQGEAFVPFLEIPCSAIVATGTCAEYIFKTGATSASFLVTSPGASASVPDRSDVLSYDGKTQAVSNQGSYATARTYRYRNTRGESLSSRMILRHESQSTFLLFDANTGVSTPINLPMATYMDASSIYSINEQAGTLDLLVANSFESDPSKNFSVFHMDLNNPSSSAPRMGLVSVPPAGSNNAALPYTVPQDGLDLTLNLGFQANAKAIDQQSHLYFYLPSAIYMAPLGSSKLVKLLDLESAADCGGQAFHGTAKEGELRTRMKTTMKNLCYNKTDGLFVANGCRGRQGFLNFVIRQYYGSESANLTLVTAPCTLLP